jgi:hypothetical protein
LQASSTCRSSRAAATIAAAYCHYVLALPRPRTAYSEYVLRPGRADVLVLSDYQTTVTVQAGPPPDELCMQETVPNCLGGTCCALADAAVQLEKHSCSWSKGGAAKHPLALLTGETSPSEKAKHTGTALASHALRAASSSTSQQNHKKQLVDVVGSSACADSQAGCG